MRKGRERRGEERKIEKINVGKIIKEGSVKPRGRFWNVTFAATQYVRFEKRQHSVVHQMFSFSSNLDVDLVVMQSEDELETI